jgi:hypothetical protein
MAHSNSWTRRLKTGLLTNTTIGAALAPDVIEAAAHALGHVWRDTFWKPSTTLLAFLLQVLSPEKTLRAAVGDLLTQLAALGEERLPSGDPSAYCQARQRVPFDLHLVMLAGVWERIRRLANSCGTWLGRRVWIVDGTTVSMPDEPELQEAFPQPSGQKRGCGFPVARLVVLFCWATGAIRDVVIDSLHTHELPLFRKLWSHFQKGDVVLCDRAYCSFADLHRLRERGVFCVFRLHQRRRADFRQGRRLGEDDQLVTWPRPPWQPKMGLSREEVAQLPETLTVRLVRITGAAKGFRSRTIVVVTTLLDPIETPADEIRALYRDRWLAELNLRSLKTQLGMDVLRGESVDVVTKEMVMHLLAYNLIRLLMWQAAREHGRNLHRLSFTGTLHRLRDVFPLVLRTSTGENRERLMAQLRKWIADDKLPDRPNRFEPRRKKRRPKEYSLLQRPRQWYRLHGDPDAR